MTAPANPSRPEETRPAPRNLQPRWSWLFISALVLATVAGTALLLTSRQEPPAHKSVDVFATITAIMAQGPGLAPSQATPGTISNAQSTAPPRGAALDRTPPAAPTATEVTIVFPTQDAGTALDQSPQPSLSLSANGGTGTVIYRGWPVLLDGSLLGPQALSSDETLAPVLICSASDHWTDAITVQVRNDKGQLQNWAWRLVTSAPEEITIDGETSGQLLWVLAPEATAGIGPGLYQVTAVLDTTRCTREGAWKGSVTSPSVSVGVGAGTPLPESDPPADDKFRLLAYYNFVLGDLPRALSENGKVLARHPTDVSALALQGDILAAQADYSGALSAYDRAIEEYYKQNPGAEEPPGDLFLKQADVLNKLNPSP